MGGPGDGRAAALDLRLVGAEAESGSVTKLDAVAEPVRALQLKRKHSEIEERVATALEAAGLKIATDDQIAPDYLGKFVQSETAKWAATIKASGISID